MKLRHALMLLVSSLLSTGILQSQPTAHDYLELVQHSLPQCNQMIDLDITNEYFTEISNPLPGKDFYNELVMLLREENYLEIKKRAERFSQIYKASPLIEAVDFISLQASFFMALENKVTKEDLELEKNFRNIELMYPNSVLLPGLYASVGYFSLKRGDYGKAIRFYETAAKKHAGHAFECVFLTGVAEGNFQFGNLKASKLAFENVLKHCQNPRLRLGALFRMADVAWQTGDDKLAASRYKTGFEDALQNFLKFYPTAYYHYGELFFRKKEYAQANYHFQEFTKKKGVPSTCLAAAYMRLGDISLAEGKSLLQSKLFFGRAYEADPSSDSGKLSRLLSLLVDYEQGEDIEKQRRMKIVDEQLENITDKSFREAGFLAKGLVLLSSGKMAAVDYLMRYMDQSDQDLKKGQLGHYIQGNLLQILETEAKSVREHTKAEDHLLRTQKERDLLLHIKNAYNVWLKGTSFDKHAKNLYEQIMFSIFVRRVESKRALSAIQWLERWEKDDFLSLSGMDPKLSQKIGKHLVEAYINSDDKTKISLEFIKRKKFLEPFLKGNLQTFWASIALELEDEKLLKATLKSGGRGLASISDVDASKKDFLLLSLGKGYLRLKNYALSEEALLNVKASPFKEQAEVSRLELYKESQQYLKAYQLRKKNFESLSKEQQLERIKELKEWIEKGRLWTLSSELLSLSKKLNLEKPVLAGYYFLAGKGAFENANVTEAIPYFEKAIEDLSDEKSLAEARFKLGKSLLDKRKKGQAQAVWSDLVKMNDEFWSPLAKNELLILK